MASATAVHGKVSDDDTVDSEQSQTPFAVPGGVAVPTDRTLVVVVELCSVAPHPKHDDPDPKKRVTKIAVAMIPNWGEVIVQVSEQYKAGDKAIYLLTDSVPDSREGCPTAFLRGEPLLARSMFGVTSYGLLLPLSAASFYGIDEAALQTGVDLTKHFHIRKFVREAEACQYHKDGHASIPSDIPSTSLLRIQELTRLIDYAKQSNLPLVCTLKYDGASCTSFVDDQDDSFALCGRNWRWQRRDAGTEPYYRMAEAFRMETKIRRVNETTSGSVIIQAELEGPSFANNHMRLPEDGLHVFKVYDKSRRRPLCRALLEEFCQQHELPIAEKVFHGLIPDSWTDVNSILAFVEQLKYANGLPAEGMVIQIDGAAGEEFTYMEARVLSRPYEIQHNRTQKQKKDKPQQQRHNKINK